MKIAAHALVVAMFAVQVTMGFVLVVVRTLTSYRMK